jgi:hypothetical protein
MAGLRTAPVQFPFMMHAMDGSGRLTRSTGNGARPGYLPSDVIGKSFKSFDAAVASHLITSDLSQNCRRPCRARNVCARRRDAGHCPAVDECLRGDKGRIERSICLMQDVTDQKVPKLPPARSDQRFRGAFAAQPMAWRWFRQPAD